jgi:hypothetical protein
MNEFARGFALATILAVLIAMLASCTPTLTILDGATHACGQVHVEGYFTDTQGEVIVAKAPPEWTPEQVRQFCNLDG